MKRFQFGKFPAINTRQHYPSSRATDTATHSNSIQPRQSLLLRIRNTTFGRTIRATRCSFSVGVTLDFIFRGRFAFLHTISHVTRVTTAQITPCACSSWESQHSCPPAQPRWPLGLYRRLVMLCGSPCGKFQNVPVKRQCKSEFHDFQPTSAEETDLELGRSTLRA